MSSDETSRRQGDNIGVNLCIKFRLSNMAHRTLYYYAWEDDVVPWGNLVKKTQSGIVWKTGRGEFEESPGINKVVTGSWMALPEGTAIEWDDFDFPGEKVETHAATLFVKWEIDGSWVEVLSDFYDIPARSVKASL